MQLGRFSYLWTEAVLFLSVFIYPTAYEHKIMPRVRILTYITENLISICHTEMMCGKLCVGLRQHLVHLFRLHVHQQFLFADTKREKNREGNRPVGSHIG